MSRQLQTKQTFKLTGSVDVKYLLSDTLHHALFHFGCRHLCERPLSQTFLECDLLFDRLLGLPWIVELVLDCI
jgi:hypothetical protein